MPKAAQAKPRRQRKGATKKKARYRVQNWPQYNQALKQRGSLTVYLDEALPEQWYAPAPGSRGAPPLYSDAAIRLTLQLGLLYGQPLRQTQGLVASLFERLGLDLPVPDYSTLSRRRAGLAVPLPKSAKKQTVLVLDSSGLKVYGEGEWKVRQHGWSKRRTWRKMHLAVDADGEIRAATLTGNDAGDGQTAQALLEQETATITAVAGDGGYDDLQVYEQCQSRGVARVLIPPQRNAKIIRHGNAKGEPHPRDENLRRIRKSGRKKWKKDSGYHIRSKAETAMFRYKTIFGDRLRARRKEGQRTEFLLCVGLLNRMMKLGMPKSCKVA